MEIKDNMEIVKHLEEYSFLQKGNNEASENEVKEQKERYLRILLGIFSTSLLKNLLSGEGVIHICERTVMAGDAF